MCVCARECVCVAEMGDARATNDDGVCICVMVVRVRVRLIWISRCSLYKTAPEVVME